MKSFKLRRSCPTEHQEQAAFMSWLARFHPEVYELTYHVPNGRLTAKEGSKYKAVGAKSGVPDLCIAYPIDPYHGLYIEFKRVNGGSGLSGPQKKWIDKLMDYGYLALVANGFEEAVAIINNYVNSATENSRW